jgi:hypothetical protein
MGAYEYQKVGMGSINGQVTDMDSNPIKFALVIAINSDTKTDTKHSPIAMAIMKFPTYYLGCVGSSASSVVIKLVSRKLRS